MSVQTIGTICTAGGFLQGLCCIKMSHAYKKLDTLLVNLQRSSDHELDGLLCVYLNVSVCKLLVRAYMIVWMGGGLALTIH